MATDRKEYRQSIYAALNTNPKFGPKFVTLLLNRFGTIDQAWAKNTDLSFINWRAQINIKENYQRYQKLGIKIVSWEDDDYPLVLGQLPDKPYILYYRGTINKSIWGVGVVGARKWTEYGRQATKNFVEGIVKANIPIISGLALGIDGIAHQTCLDHNGITVAVMPGGLDRVYPASHHHLAEQIVAKGGLLLSEYPVGTLAYPNHFPVRNRIIAGLSKGVLIIEANLKSGSLLTARAALEYNREVFTVPHSIFSPTGQGPNNLLKMGATLVTSVDDILSALNIDYIATKPMSHEHLTADTALEQIIIDHLRRGPLHLDALAAQAQIPIHELNATITLMEMKGKVMNLGGNVYQLR